ncbi:hypothetical protein MUK42_01464 [Musa troglodytarum]|uniref:Uncharacterized protein n=1 Tax=Musa troglodytarum TaxID=320322 RepID=A0A9E7FC84_9LILI|nr:hypothetical protein MUK42_01464 [Musa troglodytarum]
MRTCSPTSKLPSRPSTRVAWATPRLISAPLWTRSALAKTVSRS